MLASVDKPISGGLTVRGTGSIVPEGEGVESARSHMRVRTLHLVNRFFTRVYHQVEVERPNVLPARGAAILVCNHISGLDPLLLQGIIPRAVVWMMAREYYELPILKHVFRTIEAIPVERSGRDSAATRAALRALSSGRILGIFPEGKIETTTDLLPFQTGVAMMAHRTGVPVYPAYLDGTNRGMEMVPALIAANHAAVRFGPPMHFKSIKGEKPDLDIATARITDSIASLKADMTYRR